ncbi:hypothetical protein MRX96_022176 [Rhipicephalus microplus]
MDETKSKEHQRHRMRLLERVGLSSPEEQDHETSPLMESTMRRLVVYPLPKNMGPGESEGRRAARARALLLQHQNDEGAVYVDVAKVKNKDAYVAAAVAATTGKIVTSCSVRTRSASQAEEMAIALAARSPGVRTILSDSKTAIRSFSRGAGVATNQQCCRTEVQGRIEDPRPRRQSLPEGRQWSSHSAVEALGLQMDKNNIDCIDDKECNMCWDVCRFFNDDFEVWRHMCAVEELCFPGCRQACSFWYKASPKQLGNPLMSVSDVFAGMFFEPARLEGHGPHNVRITWSRPESTMDDNIERALVYVIFLRGLFDDQRWEDVAQTQYLNATVRRSQLKQASEVKVIALSPYGVFAHTQVGLDLDLAAYDSLQADDSITSALPIFAAPNVVEIKHSSGYRVEVDIAWEFGLSLQAKDVKYEVTWIIPDRAADVSGRMYTSQQSATLQLWEGTSYSIFVRRLSPVTGKPDAETLSRYLNTPVVEPKQSTQHAASTDTCVRLEVVVACAALATAIVFVSVASLAVSLMRKSDRSKREHPASAESASSEKSGSERRCRRGSQLCSGTKSLLGMHPASGPASPVGESHEDLLSEAQREGGTNQCFVYDTQSA